MYLVYYDESGDDGYPTYSSPLFVLSAVYLHHQVWKDVHNNISEYRRYLNNTYALPVKVELHTKNLLTNKAPYRSFNFDTTTRAQIFFDTCSFIASLSNAGLQIVNVVINKAAVTIPNYDVLDRALTYSIQRVENDLNKSDPISKFMIITDPGRVGKMRRIARKIQRINYIPSHFGIAPYRKEINRLIEDPLPKESDQSHFIQIADLVSYLVHLYELINLNLSPLPNRLPPQVNPTAIINLMELIKPVLNLSASSSNPYGIVCYPK